MTKSQSVSRRDFLAGSAATGVALAGPYLRSASSCLEAAEANDSTISQISVSLMARGLVFVDVSKTSEGARGDSQLMTRGGECLPP